MSLTKHDIQIVIVDDSRGEKCETSCGLDWSSAEAISLADQSIKERFGDRVRLEYLDLSKPMNSHRVLALNQRIKELPLPRLVINGKSIISGQFDTRRLLDAIDAEIEIKL